MAKLLMTELRCDRCKRVEYVEATDAHAQDASVQVPALHLVMGDEHLEDTEVLFHDLCSPCKKTVSRYVEQISKPMAERKSPARVKGRAKKKGDSPPSPVATSGTVVASRAS